MGGWAAGVEWVHAVLNASQRPRRVSSQPSVPVGAIESLVIDDSMSPFHLSYRDG